MLRFPWLALAICLLASNGSAQSDAKARLRPITAPVKNAGVLHLETGTWTRTQGRQALLGTSNLIVYSNTCDTAYYAGQHPGGGEIFTDEGAIPAPDQARVPSTLIPGSNDADAGCATSYNITGFKIGYCTNNFQSYAAIIRFYDVYETVGTSCAIPGSPVASFALTDLPAGSFSVQACWVVTIDVAGAGNFSLSGTGATSQQLFGWSFSTTSTATFPSTPDGPIVAGAPSVCSGTDATRWDRGTSNLPSYPGNFTPGSPFPTANELATGMLSLDAYRIDGPTTAANGPGCYFFQGNTFASFYFELYSDVDPCLDVCLCTAYCFPAEQGVIPCPCGNNPLPGSRRGCDNSVGTGGAQLTFTGVASVSSDSLTITATDERPNAASLFLQGNASLPGGAIFGDGVRCVSGQLLRLNSPGGTQSNASGSVSYPSTGFPQSVTTRSSQLGQPINAGDTRYYQTHYRDPDPVFCPSPLGNTWNATHAQQLTWSP